VDDGIHDTTCADSVHNHCEGKPDNRLEHDFADVPDDSDSNCEDCKEGKVLEKNSCERKCDLDVASKTLVEELKDLCSIRYLILTNEPLIFLLVELFSLVALVLLK